MTNKAILLASVSLFALSACCPCGTTGDVENITDSSGYGYYPTYPDEQYMENDLEAESHIPLPGE